MLFRDRHANALAVFESRSGHATFGFEQKAAANCFFIPPRPSIAIADGMVKNHYTLAGLYEIPKIIALLFPKRVGDHVVEHKHVGTFAEVPGESAWMGIDRRGKARVI